MSGSFVLCPVLRVGEIAQRRTGLEPAPSPRRRDRTPSARDKSSQLQSNELERARTMTETPDGLFRFVGENRHSLIIAVRKQEVQYIYGIRQSSFQTPELFSSHEPHIFSSFEQESAFPRPRLNPGPIHCRMHAKPTSRSNSMLNHPSLDADIGEGD